MAEKGRQKGRVRVLTRKREVEPGFCLLIENGRPCIRPIASRGLCGMHATWLRTQGRLNEFALPAQKLRRYHIELKERPEPGVCRVVVRGAPCEALAERRGLCVRHYATIWRRPDLDLDAFCLPPVAERLQLKREMPRGLCRLREEGVDCTERVHARGLCRRHYRKLAESPGLFERFALPTHKRARLARRRHLKDGRCRVSENGEGCSAPAEVRGLCRRHAGMLRRDPALRERIALPSRRRPRAVFTRRPPEAIRPEVCVVVEDDVPCNEPTFRRGVCRRHHTILGSHADYSLLDFYTEEPEAELRVKAEGDRADGLCIAIQDGIACEAPPLARGFCRRHYRYIHERGLLDALGLPPRSRYAPHGAANDLPHGYLDKNVLFDHADHVVFATPGQEGSVQLVEQARRGAFRASVSIDAVKTTYNHLRHRLQRPLEEGGKSLEEEDAERIARDYVRDTFFRGGAWRFVALAAAQIGAVVLRDDTALSLEDALELEAYESTCRGRAAPTWFVTRDTDFLEGVHPTHLARELGWLQPAAKRTQPRET